MNQDELDRRIREAAQGLRRQAPEQDKLALLRRLRQQTPAPSLLQRLAIAWERNRAQWRQPLYGLAFAALLAIAIGVGITLDPSGIDAPQIDDIEFGGGSAVVMQTHSEHTTLIWLSEVDEGEDNSALPEDENGRPKEVEEEPI